MRKVFCIFRLCLPLRPIQAGDYSFAGRMAEPVLRNYLARSDGFGQVQAIRAIWSADNP